MFIYIWMSHLYCYLFSFILCLVYLTYRSGSDWFWIKLLKDIFDVFTIIFLEILSCCLKGMKRCILSQILNFSCHIRTNDISSVTKILKSFDEDNSGSFDCFDEKTEPIVLCFIKK